MRFTYITALVIALGIPTTFGFSQTRKDRKEAQKAESARPKNVAGGIKCQTQKSYQDTYDLLLNWVKRADYTIESADRENGWITTAMTITGGYRQTGTRLLLTLIKDSETETTVRVVVTEQKRKKLLATDPWSDPKANERESQRIADQLKILF